MNSEALKKALLKHRSAIYLKYAFLKKLKKFYDFPRLPELSIINEEQRAICVNVDDMYEYEMFTKELSTISSYAMRL
ncbi:hypothetical protein T07_11337 [Trichinella nelsoni]|uniref:Uncharacterized protein n=1 Tax=Trichinella nelsoni TaxID=6336 RepID=A0A0V0SDY4_9BILA|nr:hypothetical protein T07_11337 [Trichinella nelsoni]